MCRRQYDEAYPDLKRESLLSLLSSMLEEEDMLLIKNRMARADISAEPRATLSGVPYGLVYGYLSSIPKCRITSNMTSRYSTRF